MPDLYTATATATGGRQGGIRLSDSVLDQPLALPKELGGPGGGATNPEQLFAAGDAACFENALLRAAREHRAQIRESSVTAHVTIARNEEGLFRLATVLEVSVPDRDRAEIAKLARNPEPHEGTVEAMVAVNAQPGGTPERCDL